MTTWKITAEPSDLKFELIASNKAVAIVTAKSLTDRYPALSVSVFEDDVVMYRFTDHKMIFKHKS